MACPTCSETMQGLGYNIFWCPRCGSIRFNGSSAVPALVHRVRELHAEMKSADLWMRWHAETWHKLGVSDAIDLPEHRIT